MTREKALDKIRKLLALSASDQPHEAAAALRQAHALMRQHGVDDADVALSAVNIAETGGARSHAPWWFGALINTVAKAFGCRAWMRVHWQHREAITVHFMGVDRSAEIASYAFDVLRRRLTSERAAYYRRTRGKRAGRIERANQFANGWIKAVAREVARFAGKPPALVDQAFAARSRGFVDHEPRPGRLDRGALRAGYEAGSKVNIHSGIGGEHRQSLEHHDAAA